MILLVATRLNDKDRYSYSIGAAGRPARFTTENVANAVDELERLGVKLAVSLIAHARIWGSVEIVEKDAA